MQPIILSQFEFKPFKIPFIQSFSFAGHTISERSGFYITLQSDEGITVQGEASPLEGISSETVRRVRHDLTQSTSYLKEFKIPRQRDELLSFLRQDPHILNLCPSVRFGVESCLLMMAAKASNLSLAEFLGAELKNVSSAVLLQGTHAQVLADVRRYVEAGIKVFKLKVGDRNIALDVKKIQDIRLLLTDEAYLRLDGNRVWTFKEACIFAELAGIQKIDFIEEPINDVTQLDAFYEKTRMRIALDETLSVVRCGVRAPGRCTSPLALHDGIVAYVLKPMVLGLLPVLDWIEEAKNLKRKAIISSSFESPVGFKVLANLACLSGQVSGLGTERWFKGITPLVDDNGIIKKELLV